MAKQQEHDDLALQLGVLQYNTTARTCGCPSFRYGKGRPCKHMRALHDAAAMLRAAGYQVVRELPNEIERHKAA